MISILAALDDPNLFASHFRDAHWDRWRVFLAALFGLPMDEDQLAIYRHHTGRTAPPASPSKEAALVVGRRGGKSRVLALVATYLATFRDYEQYLAPGEMATVAVIAANRRQARSIFRYMSGMFRSVDLLTGMVISTREDALELNNRVVIEIHTASFRVTRGYTFAAVLADETAFWRDENSRNPDIEIFRALRPGLANIPGSILLNASSPYRKSGVLYNTFRRHYARDDARVLVWRGTTAEMNPTIDPAIIEEAYEDDPASASAEYGAEFRDDIADFVAREVVDACTPQGLRELPPASSQRYHAFVDPSGGSSDSMTLAISHRESDVAVLDAVREVRPPFSPEAVVADFALLMRSYRVTEVVGDRYAGEWPRERFRAHGITYRVADNAKSDMYRDVLPLLNSRRVQLLDVPRLGSQFCGLERRTARGGRDSIDHGPGAHDDLANAATGALLLARSQQALRINLESLAEMQLRLRAERPRLDRWT